MAEGAGGKEVGRISIRAVPNTENFRRDLQRQLDEIEESTRAKIRIEPDLDGFREKVDAATRGLKDAKIKVKTEFDNQGKLIQDLDQMGKDAKIKLKTDLDKSSLEKTIGEAKLAAAAADVKIKVRTERRGGLRGMMDSAGSGAGNLFRGLKMPDVLPNIGGLGGIPSLLLIISALSLVAPALALLSQALVGLPALIAGVALPIGVFALGLGGIKKALDDSGILSDTKGKKGGKDKQGLGAALKELQQQVSDVFEKGFTPIFRQIGEAIPQLLRGLPFVAQGIVSLARAVTNAVVTPEFISNFDRFTNSVGTMLTNMGPGLASFTTAMSNLITNVGDHLPGLGNVMSGWADRFTGWVDKISKPKQDWFERDIPNSSTLDSAVTNLKPILNSVVNFVGQLTDAGLKLAANPQMADNIKKVVDGLTNMITSLLPQLNTVFDKLAQIMGKIVPPGQKDPALPPAKGNEQFASTPKGNAPADRKDNPQGGSQSKFDPNASAFENFWGWLDRTFTRPKTDHPVIVQGNVGQPQVTPPPAPALNTDGGAAAANGITGAFKNVPGQLAPIWSSITDGAKGAFDGLVTAAADAASRVIAEISKIPPAVTAALAGLGPAGEAAGQALGTGMAAGIAAGAPSAIAAAQALAQGVENATKGALGIHSPSKVFQGIGENTAQGYQDGLEGGFQGVLDSARNLAKQVSDAMGGANDTNVPGLPHSPWAYKQAPHIPGMVPQGGTDQIPSVDPGNLMPLDPGGVPIDSMPAGFQSKQLQDQIQDQLKAIKVEQDQLRADKDGTADKGQKKAIQGQIDQLNVAKDQLKVQATSLGYSTKYGDSQADSTKQQRAQLDLQEQQLKAQYDATTDPAKRRELKVQMDQIKAQKDMLGSGKSKDGTDNMTQQLGQSLNKMVDIGKNFAMANVNQFESDIGISGQGAIPTIANIGLNWATGMLGNMVTGALGGGGQTHIHVNNVDDAVEAHTRTANKQAMQYTGRSSST